MSAICVLVPTVVAVWPAISAAASGAATALGLTLVREVEKVLGETKTKTRTSVDVPLEESEVVGSALSTGEEMVFTKGTIRVRVYRDERGECRICVEGEEYHSKRELTALAERFAGKLTQIFVYNKVMSELENKGFAVVKNEVGEDQSVHLHVRRTVS